ncbi:MAG: outer membrane protein [Motiliproteus sp.]|jgi:outer membrane protein
MKTLIFTAIAGAALGLASTTVAAFETGDIVVRGGLTNVAPQDDSGKVHVGGTATPYEVSVDNDTQLGLNLVYFYTPRVAVELLAATPFSHDMALENAGALNGPLGESKQLPPTLSVLYYFGATDAALQPYAGVGVNYTAFFDEKFTAESEANGFSDLELDNSFGLAVQAGFDYQLDKHWMINGSVRYIDIDTTANFKTGGTSSHVDVDIDPIVSSLMVGYRF